MSMPMPIIRLEVEALKYQVLHAMQAHHTEIEAAVEAELQRVIVDFEHTFEVMVREEVAIALRSLVSSSLRRIVQDQVGEEIARRFREAFQE